jgi:hypothetical protein
MTAFKVLIASAVLSLAAVLASTIADLASSFAAFIAGSSFGRPLGFALFPGLKHVAEREMGRLDRILQERPVDLIGDRVDEGRVTFGPSPFSSGTTSMRELKVARRTLKRELWNEPSPQYNGEPIGVVFARSAEATSASIGQEIERVRSDYLSASNAAKAKPEQGKVLRPPPSEGFELPCTIRPAAFARVRPYLDPALPEEAWKFWPQ